MRKKFAASAILMALLLTGCSNNNTSKSKLKVPYSDLIKDTNSSMSSTSETISQNTESNEIDSSCAAPDDNSVLIVETQPSPATDFEYKTNDFGEITITKYIGQDKVITIPSEIEGKSVSELDHKVFYDCADITDITIPDSVLTIGLFVFNGCDNLQNINVDNSNINFSSKDGVLFNEDGSALIQFPCGRKGNYDIPNGTKIIENKSFQECNQLSSVTIPDSVTTIGDGAFYKCARLKSVKGNKNISEIPPGAFGNCISLSEIELNDNLKTINFDAFTGCDSLSQVTFPDSLSKMGERAIDGCLKIHVTYKGKTYDYYEREQLRQAVNGNQNNIGHTSTSQNPPSNQQTTPANQTQDNSKAIRELNETIATYSEEIALYREGIEYVNTAISEIDSIQTECEANLRQANINLTNAKKQTTWVYNNDGFKQVPDVAAVAKAQEAVTAYEELIAECETSRDQAKKKIEEYEIEISARESAILICQSEINKLS